MLQTCDARPPSDMIWFFQTNHHFFHYISFLFNPMLLIFLVNLIFRVHGLSWCHFIYLECNFIMNYYYQPSDLIKNDGLSVVFNRTHGSFSMVLLYRSLAKPFIIQHLLSSFQVIYKGFLRLWGLKILCTNIGSKGTTTCFVRC